MLKWGTQIIVISQLTISNSWDRTNSIIFNMFVTNEWKIYYKIRSIITEVKRIKYSYVTKGQFFNKYNVK